MNETFLSFTQNVRMVCQFTQALIKSVMTSSLCLNAPEEHRKSQQYMNIVV